MRVLVIHNAYQLQGGEDAVVANEVAALRRSGCEVETFLISNDQIRSISAKVQAWFQIVDGGRHVDEVASYAKSFRPDVVHVHNHFPLLSPSIHRAMRRLGFPTVQTFHNFRYACASALFYRNGAVCSSCLNGSPYRAVLHACYRGSRMGSFAVARSIDHHRRAKTWSKDVDRIIALTEFARDFMIKGGVPPDKIVVKPNGLRDHAPPGARRSRGVLYVGRLSEEKGVMVLAKAARQTDCPITVVGEGPLASSLEGVPNLEMRGWISPEEVRMEMARSSAVVVPSLCFEGLPMAVVEAFASGTPVIASRIGSLAGLVDHEIDGLLVEAGDPPMLAAAIESLTQDAARAALMGAAGRRKYERQWTEEATTSSLLAIYEEAKVARDLSRNLPN